MYCCESTAVRVAVRVRPPTTDQSCVAITEKMVSVTDDLGLHDHNDLRCHCFPVDNAFGAQSVQSDLAEFAVHPAVEKVVSGVSAAVMCYGQTGSM
jgi:hypothetical protein